MTSFLPVHPVQKSKPVSISPPSDGRPSTPPKKTFATPADFDPVPSPVPEPKSQYSGRPSTPQQAEDNSAFTIYGSSTSNGKSEDSWQTTGEYQKPFVTLDRPDRGQSAGNRGLEEPGDDFDVDSPDYNEPGDDIDGDLIEIR